MFWLKKKKVQENKPENVDEKVKADQSENLEIPREVLVKVYEDAEKQGIRLIPHRED